MSSQTWITSGFYLHVGNKFWGGSIINSGCGRNTLCFVIICNNIYASCTTCTCILQVMHTLTPNIDIWTVLNPRLLSLQCSYVTGQNFLGGSWSVWEGSYWTLNFEVINANLPIAPSELWGSFEITIIGKFAVQKFLWLSFTHTLHTHTHVHT